jgi:hypothetical protein
MAGILEKKSRIIDTIITDEGRRQMFTGQLQIKFVAFSDGAAYYKGDEVSGSADAQSRIYFEATSLPQDQVTFEADDSGKLKAFKGGGSLGVYGGKILTGSADKRLTFVTGSEFASLAGTLLSGSLDNFDKLRIIGTSDFFLDDDNFTLSRPQVAFTSTRESPIPSNAVQTTTLDDVESLFQDKRLSHIPNFKFLPPLNRPTIEEPEGSLLGNFIPIGQGEVLTLKELRASLQGKPSEVIEFLNTSRPNNIMGQLFEIMPNEVKKLDIVDFGSFPSDRGGTDVRVFFAGKIFTDSRGSHTFVNIFTLIFS